MKQLYIAICLLLTSGLYAQNQIERSQYWFNNSFTDAVTEDFAVPGLLVTFSESISTAMLGDGLHTFHIRFQDTENKWTSTLSSFFYKVPVEETVASEIREVQYWFNNNFAGNVTQNTANQQLVSFISDIDAAGLSDGLHTFHIRFKDNAGKWSSTLSSFFYKVPVEETVASEIREVQYWFNNDFAGNVTQNTANQQLVNFTSDIDAVSLSDGLHTFHIRFKDSTGKWSSALSSFFFKMPVEEITDNKITLYRYWFNDDFENVINVELDEPISPYSLISLMDMKLLPAADYEIHFQFKDEKGLWSSVLSEMFTKNLLPYAEFSVDNDEFCGEGSVQFQTFSVDADTYHWDFGDGNESSELEPLHFFESPGEYNVTLTASDFESGLESSYSSMIYVYQVYEFIEEHEICDGEVYEWQGGEYFETGTYYADHQSVTNCDSTYVLHLDVNEVYEFIEEHEICDGEVYEWQGGEYFETGTYYADYQSITNCDSTYVLHLDVNEVYEFVEEHEICDGEVFEWQGGEYFETGTYYADHQSITNCDSTYVLHLDVNEVYEFVEEHEICDGEVYEWQGGEYFEAGTYYADYQSITNCDSTYVLHLSVFEVDTSVSLEETTLIAHAVDADFQWIDCSDNSEIDGETSNAFTPNVSGEYAVIVVQNACTAVSDCYEVIITSIEEIFHDEAYIYPNPAKSEVNIVLGKTLESFNINVYDIEGKKIKAFENLSGNEYKISLDDLTSGVYFIEINYNGVEQRFKLIKDGRF